MFNNPNEQDTLKDDIAYLRQRVRELEEQLSTQTAELFFFRALAEHAPDSIAFANLEHIITYANPAFCAMMGYDDVLGALGANVELLYAAAPEQVAEMRGQVTSQGAWQGMLTYRRRDGSTFVGQLSAFALYDEQGQMQGIGGIVRDLTQQVQMEQSLRESEARYREITELISDNVYSIHLKSDGQGVREWGFERAELFTGYSATEIDERGWVNIIHPDDQPHFTQERRPRLLAGEPVVSEVRIITRDGAVRWIRDHGCPVWDAEQGRVVRIYGAVQDITERKQAEEALRESQQFIAKITATIPDMVYVYDMHEQRNVYVNHEIATILGYTPEEVQAMGPAVLLRLLHPDDVTIANEQLAGLARSADGAVVATEYRMRHADGTWRWLAVRETIFARTASGAARYMLGIAQDITERKQAEEAYRVLVEHSLQGLAIIQDGISVFVNPAAVRITGYNAQEIQTLATKHIDVMTYPDDQDRLRGYYKARMAGEYAPSRYEYRMVHRNGDIRWIENYSVLVEYGGRPAVQATFIDITERKLAEEALRESQRLIEQILATVPAIVYIYDPIERRTIFVNDSVLPVLGYTPGEVRQMGTTFLERMAHPDEADRHVETNQRSLAAADGEIIENEYRLRHKDGTWRWFNSRDLVLTRNGAGTPTRILGTALDITERKQMEEVLCESEARYRLLATNFPNGAVFLFDHDLRYLVARGQGLAVVGLATEQLEGKTIWECLDAATCAVIEPLYRAVLAGTAPNDLETVCSGHIYRLRPVTVWNEQGQVMAGMVVTQDITEQKRAEAALRENQSLLQGIIDNAPAVIVVKDREGRYILANQRAAANLALTPADMIGHSEATWFPPEQVRAFRASDQQVMATGVTIETEDVALLPDGLRTYLAIKFPLYSGQGEMYAIGAIATDITERKRMEEALRESERFIQRIVDTTPAIVYVHHLQERRSIYTNRQVMAILGYTSEEIQAIGAQFAEMVIHPDDLSLKTVINPDRLQTARDDEIIESEYRMRTASGEWRWLYSREMVFTRDDTGRVEHIIGTALDITERKQAEEALRKSETILRATIDASTDTAIGLATLDGRISLANTLFAEILGWTPATIVGKHMDELYPPVVAASRLAGIQHIVTTQTTMRMEHKLNGRWYDEMVFPVATPDSGVMGVGVMSREITQRKHLEEALQQRMQTLDALRATLNELSGNLELDTLLHAIVERAVVLLHATDGGLSLHDPEHNDLQVVVSYNTGRDYTGVRLAMGEGATGQVAITRQPLIVPNYQSWAGRITRYPQYATRAGLFVPLLAGEQLVGVIAIGDTNPERSFTVVDSDVLTLFAQQAAIAIQNARLFAEVQQLATTDPLMGLYNRRHFFALAQHEFEQTRRYNRPLSIIMLDIDNFKRINDTYGHLVGDQVLQALARQCRATVRSVDVIGRYGGEEIVVLLPETDQEGARQIAERLRSQLALMPIPVNGESLHITVSLGVAAAVDIGSIDLDRLIDYADQSLYVAKHAGKNRVVVWNDGRA